MGIMNLQAPAILRGVQNGDFFQIKVLDSTTFCTSPMTTNFGGFIPTGMSSIGTTALSTRNFSVRLNTATAPTITRSGLEGQYRKVFDYFDFRWRFTKMDMPNGYCDGTFAFIIGMLYQNDFPSNGGRFYMKVDSPAVGQRRVCVIFGRFSQGTDVTVYQRTEAYSGEFGPLVTSAGHLQGNVIRNLRIARAGNKLLAEWNFYNDGAGFDSDDNLTAAFVNRVFYYPDNGFNLNNGSGDIFNENGNGGVAPRMFARFNSGAGTAGATDFTAQMSINRFESVPAICIDTTNDNTFADVWKYTSDTIDFTTKGRGEGFGDIKIYQWGALTTASTQNSGDLFQFDRKELVLGSNCSFLYDNKLRIADSGDLKRDLYVNNIYKGSRNQGNLNPIVTTDLVSGLTNKIYGITVNRDGFLEDRVNEDSTDFNAVLDMVTATQLNNKLYYGQNNLPSFVFSDGTYNLGRDAMFRPIYNVYVGPQSAGELGVIDQCKFLERDSTSYYIIEVMTDGTHFSVYTRIFNIYDQSLGSRVLVNQDTTVFNKNPTYSLVSGDWFPLTMTHLKPNPHLIRFDNKHVMALTVHDAFPPAATDPTISYRLFYESEDKGLTWFLRDKVTRNVGQSLEYLTGDTHSFNLGTNKNMFLNVTVSEGFVTAYYHRADNFARKPIYFSNLMQISRLYGEAARFIHCSYDPIQKSFAMAISFFNGYTEVIRSPKFLNESVKNFDAGARDQNTQYFESFPPNNKWLSEYAIRAFSDTEKGKSFVSFDRNGDLLVVSNKSIDSTSFAISRTSALKDDLNVMGSFLQCALKDATRENRYITEMFTDENGDIILSSVSPTDKVIHYGLMKYGQLSNVPGELNHDEGYLYPQKMANPGVHINDTTILGWKFNPSISGIDVEAWIGNASATLATVQRALSLVKGGGGFKAEWRSFYETPKTVPAVNQLRLRFSLCGDPVDSTPTIKKVQFNVTWTQTYVFITNNLVSQTLALGTFNLDISKLRRYMVHAQPTPDYSCRIVLYGENLNLTNIEKIIWDKYIDIVIPQEDSLSIEDKVSVIGTSANNDSLRMEYIFATKTHAPLQPQRNNRCAWVGEKLAVADFTNYRNFNGIPIQGEILSKFIDGVRVDWDGVDGVTNDSWTFNLASSSDPQMTVDDEPFKAWRSVSDNTTCIVVYDATSQNLNLVSGNIAVFKNSNFRRCFVEAATVSLKNSATTPNFSKEVFFDIDSGVVTSDATNYGITTVIPCAGKNWRPGEHFGRFAQFETCRVDGTPFRHLAFKVLDNAEDAITVRSGPNRFDTTAGMRYVLYDPNTCVQLDLNSQHGVFGQNYWRIRVPPHQIQNDAAIGDETAQGSVYLEGYRELGEFDLGFLSNPGAYDIDMEVTLETDVRSTEFVNQSSVNVEFARPRLIRKLKYTYGSQENMNKLKNMFQFLYGSGKTLWMFDDPENFPTSFIFCRIINQPQFQEINDGIQSISLELEEIV